jgi:hypothetical protein
MIRRSTLIAAEILMGLVAALLIGVGVTWWRLSQGPLELGFIRETVQSELSAARGGRPVGIDRVVLAMSDTGRAIELRALNVSIEDGRGGVLSRSDEARIELGLLPLLIGRVSVERAEFRGGAITFTRKLDGAVHLAFGPEGAPADIIIPAPPANETMDARVARILDGLESAFRPVGAGGGLRGLSIRGAELAIIDDAGGGRWTAHDASLELARQGASLALVAGASLEAAEGVAPANLRITTDTRFESAIMEFGAENARPRALFSPAALGPFAGLDAPVTMAVSIGLDRRAGVNRFEGEATFGRGVADMAGGRFSLDGGRVHGNYDIGSDALIIDELSFAGDRTRIGGEARLNDASRIFSAAPDQPAAFNITLPSMRLDVPGTFAEPIALTNVQAVGAIISSEGTVRFERLRAEIGGGAIAGSGRFYWAEVGSETKTGIALDAASEGAIAARALILAWPIGLGEGARAFMARSLEGGSVTDLTARLDIRPGDRAAEALPDRAIDVRYNVAEGQLRFISTMSPITAARGSAILRGNRYEMSVPQARINNLTITDARIEVPRFKPSGAMLTISGRAEGDARGMVELLYQEPLGLGDRLPIDAASVSGRGVVNIRLQRPTKEDVRFEDWRYSIDGTLRDFAGQMTTRRVAFSNGQLQVRGDHRSVTVSGPVRAGASNIQNVRWTEFTGRAARASSEYEISGDFDATDLDRLGYSVARYAQGRIGVAVTGAGRGFDVDNARIELDLTRAAVDTPFSFWTKASGVAATARFSVERASDNGLIFSNIDARGGGLTAQGRVRLARDERIIEADMPRLAIEGRSDARINAARARDGGLGVTVRGALFDAAPFMTFAEPEGQAAPTTASAASAVPPLRADVVVDRLKMRGGATLADARVSLATQRGALALLTVEGQSPSGRPFSLGLGPRPARPDGRIVFTSGDAGFAVRALTGAENIVGGTARAEGSWRTGPPSTAAFTVRMDDFQVVRLPAMARLLSSAGSLTGMVEMLNGDGIGFSALEAQMTYANNRVAFTEGSMRGPSLGLTASGAYDIRRDNLDIDGVVAPSPVLNLSMLGGVPVIGDLLVSRRGEGVFGMTYSINGRAAEPRVGVNPVSALTPGILRRIFEPIPQRESPAPTGGGAHSLPADEGSAPAPTAELETTAP